MTRRKLRKLNARIKDLESDLDTLIVANNNAQNLISTQEGRIRDLCDKVTDLENTISNKECEVEGLVGISAPTSLTELMHLESVTGCEISFL